MNKLLPIYVKKIGNDEFLISNILGYFLILDSYEMEKITIEKKRQDLENKYEISFENESLFKKLINNYFIINDENLSEYSNIYRTKNSGLFHSAGLHIFVLTLECNLNCLYCQAASDMKNCFMTKENAYKAMKILLSSPEKEITIEFQGGEPLLNFEVLKYIVEYIKNSKTEKTVYFALVNNGQAMTEEKLMFLIEHDVSICFSIDGPKYIHDKNRPSKDGNSNFDNVIYWYKRAKELYRVAGKPIRVSALPTTTKYSLSHAKDIVEFYFNDLGERTISIRPLSPFGRAIDNWEDIHYSADDFLLYYKECMEQIENLNNEREFSESFSNIILDKLNGKVVNYPDLRSPCGAGVGQIAYNWNGFVYTCDEGRMLSNQGIEKFRMGTVDNSYEELIESNAVFETCASSCLEAHKICKDCVYHSICGICPVYNYKQQGDLVGNPPEMDRCKILMGQMEYLIRKKLNNE